MVTAQVFIQMFLELVSFVCSLLSEETPEKPLGNAGKDCVFLWLKAQVLVVKVFPMGRQKEKLVFLGTYVPLELLPGVG